MTREGAPAMAGETLLPGLIVANYGRHFLLENAAGTRLICHSRGKKSAAVVGDRVWWQASQDEGTIERIEPRRNWFFRQDELRSKSFAANLDQVLILLAAEPEFSASQLARALIAAEAQRIRPLIGLNKRDLAAPFARAWSALAPYRDMGYDMLALSLASQNAPEQGELLARLSGQATLLLGPSGAGKSTLINALIPAARAPTGALSQALNAGKHTTTSTTWYWLDGAKTSALLDSPGFQEFGLRQIDAAQLAGYMPDIKAHAAQCKFYNCSHLHEPGCAVISAVNRQAKAGEISAARYQIYRDIYAELTQPKRF